MDEALRARAADMGVKVPELCRLALMGYLAVPRGMEGRLTPPLPEQVRNAIAGSVAGTVLHGRPPQPVGVYEIPPARPEIPPAPAPKVPPAWAVKKQKKADKAAGICPRCRPGMCVPEVCACGCHRR